MAIPVPPDWAAAEDITEAKLDLISTVENWLLNPPHVHCYRSASKSTANNTYTLYDMDLELYDWSTSSMHSTVTNNSRLVAPEPGIYFISALLRWDANATGGRDLLIRANAAGVSTDGTAIVEKGATPAGGNVGWNDWAGDFPLNQNEYIELWSRQSSGGSLNVLPGVHVSYLSMRWASKL